jgi:hypothetical protein
MEDEVRKVKGDVIERRLVDPDGQLVIYCSYEFRADRQSRHLGTE